MTIVCIRKTYYSRCINNCDKLVTPLNTQDISRDLGMTVSKKKKTQKRDCGNGCSNLLFGTKGDETSPTDFACRARRTKNHRPSAAEGNYAGGAVFSPHAIDHRACTTKRSRDRTGGIPAHGRATIDPTARLDDCF